jgi:undecaprenyl diphosphate synthase
MSYKDKIHQDNIPQHVAIIMDGNGRWAKGQGQERVFGHLHGVEAVRASLKAAAEVGVQYLTLYAFSTENWNRPREEVEALMNLLVKTVVGELEGLLDNGVRLHTIGDIESLPGECREELIAAKERTKNNTRINLILALSYSSRWEIGNAIKSIMESGAKKEDVTNELIQRHLETRDFPDPELLIRTSGEKRISNFLLWQIAYAELYFTPVLWPDFDKEEFYKAIVDYQSRERRFGKTSEQITV